MATVVLRLLLRIPVEDMTVDEAGWTKFYEVRNAFFKEKGIDADSEDFSFDKLAQALGMDEYSDAKLPQVGGPAISDYVKDIKVPDRFTMELELTDIVGTLPENQDTTPDIPQDLRDEYNQKMEEHGISTDDADYEMDGVFLDKIRYPAFSNGGKAVFSCFCPVCVEKMKKRGK